MNVPQVNAFKAAAIPQSRNINFGTSGGNGFKEAIAQLRRANLDLKLASARLEVGIQLAGENLTPLQKLELAVSRMKR